MLTGQSIVYFAPEKWDGMWRNRQQLMSRFAKQNKVLFVENPQYAKSFVTQWRKGVISPENFFRASVRHIADNLYVFKYPALAPVSRRFSWLFSAIRQATFQKTLQTLEMSNPIVWFARPNLTYLLHEIPPPRLKIYHVVDEYTAYGSLTPIWQQRLINAEKQMMTLADMVIVVSEKLYQSKAPHNAQTYLVANGVNYQAYSEALANPALPHNLSQVPEPRLGYVGLIGDRLNLSMLHEIAKNKPSWSLVFLGEARVLEKAEIWKALQSLSNVYYLGAVQAHQVPNYVKGLQVGLMPYQQDRASDHISPLKLYDYLAAGIPVASIEIPAAQPFRQHIHLANNANEFQTAILNALSDTTVERYQERRAIAAQHTWEARVEQLSTLIEARLANQIE